VYYVDQRAYVDEVIRQLEGWLLFEHHTQTCPFCRAMIWVGLNGHVDKDLLHSPVRHDQGDGPSDRYDRQDGPGGVWPGSNEAPGDEEDPESAASDGMGQAETQTAQGPAEDGLEGGAHAARRWEEACGGGGGKSSSQSADVEVGPSKGEQVVLPQPLR
jgi:hypothetical protein